MRWRAVSSGSIYGVSYSADAQVDTTPWTAAQVQEQVYLGKIYPDYSVGPWWNFTGSNAKWNGVYKNRAWSAGAAGAFTAPPSGRVLITHRAWGKSASSSGSLSLQVKVNRGATLRKGTNLYVSDTVAFRGTSLTTQNATFIIHGLTAGSSYNAFHVESNSGGGAEVRYPRIQVVPLPS